MHNVRERCRHRQGIPLAVVVSSRQLTIFPLSQYVGLTPNEPLGSIMPMNLGKLALQALSRFQLIAARHIAETGGNSITFRMGAWFASLGDNMIPRLTIKPPSSGCCSGAGCFMCCCGAGMEPIMQKVTSDGSEMPITFLSGMGTIIRKKVEPGEKVNVIDSSWRSPRWC